MDVNSFIESGSVELYVLGALPADEMRQIDELRLTHPALEQEIQRVQEAMASYATLHAKRPKPQLKEKIAQQLTFNEEPAQERIHKIEPVAKEEGKQIILPIFRAAAAVALIIIAGLSYSTYHFYNKSKETENQLLAMQNEKSVLANQVMLLDKQSEEVKTQLAIVSNPANKQVLLNGTTVSAESKAFIYWNPADGTTYLNTGNLPQIAANEQYQLWAIVEGKPVDLGVVTKDNAFQKMKEVKTPQAFAITLEPLGGKPSPTLEKMYVLGNV